MQQQQYSTGQFPAGKHPYLKRNGKPAVLLPKQGTYTPEGDPSHFSLDGKLGRLLRSPAFARFMDPYYDSEDASGRSTEQIWHWLTWGLGLRPWKDQTSTDLEWLDERLRTLEFLTFQKVDGHVRWFYEGF